MSTSKFMLLRGAKSEATVKSTYPKLNMNLLNKLYFGGPMIKHTVFAMSLVTVASMAMVAPALT